MEESCGKERGDAGHPSSSFGQGLGSTLQSQQQRREGIVLGAVPEDLGVAPGDGRLRHGQVGSVSRGRPQGPCN